MGSVLGMACPVGRRWRRYGSIRRISLGPVVTHRVLGGHDQLAAGSDPCVRRQVGRPAARGAVFGEQLGESGPGLVLGQEISHNPSIGRLDQDVAHLSQEPSVFADDLAADDIRPRWQRFQSTGVAPRDSTLPDGDGIWTDRVDAF